MIYTFKYSRKSEKKKVIDLRKLKGLEETVRLGLQRGEGLQERPLSALSLSSSGKGGSGR